MELINRMLDPTRTGSEAEKFEADLRKRVVGQDEAIRQIIDVYQTFMAGMSSAGRPIGNLLFLGPTGSGKTRMVEAVAESLVGDARAVVKIDCAEFQHSHEIAKLIGSPPGYLGHRETHPLLSQEALDQYQTDQVKLSFVLFDEIEKASDSLWNLLLGVLDKATLTLGDNRRVDFSRTLIFMTSNLGAAEMQALLRPNLGFAAGDAERRQAGGMLDAELTGKMASAGMEAARRKFTPEFLNRIDRVVVFQPLGTAELRKVLGMELNLVQQRIFSTAASAPFVFAATEAAKDYLLREGTDLKYGARHLKRAVDRNLVHPLSNLMATEQVRGGDLIRVDCAASGSHLTFMKEAEDVAMQAMLQMVDGSVAPPPVIAAASAVVEPKMVAHAKGSRR
ncbi:MAG: AAA family ATPase [Bryobacteraceae bacterium]|jgi:ATP-dependent Clp protease ATP-binding subunit ClpA